MGRKEELQKEKERLTSLMRPGEELLDVALRELRRLHLELEATKKRLDELQWRVFPDRMGS